VVDCRRGLVYKVFSLAKDNGHARRAIARIRISSDTVTEDGARCRSGHGRSAFQFVGQESGYIERRIMQIEICRPGFGRPLEGQRWASTIVRVLAFSIGCLEHRSANDLLEDATATHKHFSEGRHALPSITRGVADNRPAVGGRVLVCDK
jgi:hypothetical protein